MKTILKLMGNTVKLSSPGFGTPVEKDNAYFPLGPSSLPAVEAKPKERLANRTQKMLGVIDVAKMFD